MAIADLTEGSAIGGAFLLNDAQQKTTRTGDPYLSLTFADRSGQIRGNLWEVTESQVTQFQPGVVVVLDGTVGSFQDQLQVRIKDLRLASPDEGQPLDFVPHVAMTEEEMKTALRPFLAAIDNLTWSKIVNVLLSRHLAEFFSYPAAKVNHHALAGGLAFHTLSILRLARDVAGHYPGINRGLLYAGALIHDLGKVSELSGPVATQYTTTGKLLGHISIIDGEIVTVCDRLKIDPADDDVVLLRHLILSHHGLLEYGSPVRPALLEAEVLHRLDELDAAIVEAENALAKTPAGEWSDRIFPLDRRQFFHPDSAETKN